MTIRSVGYEGSVGELEWSAYLATRLGRPPGVEGPGDFEVTATSGMQVRVAAGAASGLPRPALPAEYSYQRQHATGEHRLAVAIPPVLELRDLFVFGLHV